MVKALTAGTLLAGVAVSASIAFSAPTGTPFDLGTRIASETDVSIIVDRIGDAFVSASSVVVDPAIVAAAAQASKGNLAFIPACASAVWPNIEATCLATADGRPASGRPHHHHRLSERREYDRHSAYSRRRCGAALGGRSSGNSRYSAAGA